MWNRTLAVAILFLSSAAGLGLASRSRCNGVTTHSRAVLSSEASAISGLASGTSDQEKKTITVYVTRTGMKYHRANCRYLRRSKIPISLSEACERYEPCSRCRPPACPTEDD